MSLDGRLERLGHVLADGSSRRQIIQRLKLGIRGALVALTVIYAISLAAIAIAMRIVGENNLTIAFLLFLPRIGFLLPLPFLFLPALFFHWRLALFQVVAAAAFVVVGLGWRWHPQSQPPADRSLETTPPHLTVLTYNRGQHMNQSLQPFKNATQPDIVALQEAAHRAAGYRNSEGYEEFVAAADEGEFTLLSRYPILSSSLVTISADGREATPAARFEIDFAGQPIAIYSVHFLSPRDTLLYYRRGAFLYGVLGCPGTPWAEKRRINEEPWDTRIAQARELVRIISTDPLPVLVVGDFNAPAGGYIHGLFAGRFADAHLEAGSGFGYTFPGTTRNPLSWGGPWMRIDYLFSSDQWETEWCLTEPERPSQHRAVAARFRLLEQDP